MTALPDWAAAHGDRLLTARIRQSAEDFIVTEVCDVRPSGDGEHDFLWVEKTGCNTNWAAERLAAHAGVAQRDVGFSGMKDRHAVTYQWFSVPRHGETDWDSFSEAGIKLLEHHRHQRKLRRGTHAANTFAIALRSPDIDAAQSSIEQRLQAIAACGVPNYFGRQRFGRGGSNIALARQVFGGRKMSRAKRSIALSAARSVIFNDILAERVRQGSWDQILPGELANLDGSASVFAVDAVDETLAKRCAEHDIHPSGSLWGKGSPRCTLDVADLERRVAAQHTALCDGLVGVGMDADSRALRLRVADLRWQFEPATLRISFRLAKGGYATAVLQEIADVYDS